VRQNGEILVREIVPTEGLAEAVRKHVAFWHPTMLLVGRGTGSRPCCKSLEEADFGVPLVRVDEAHTSEMARRRYVEETAPRGWQRLLPRSLRTPDKPYDDYVAVILAERHWQKP
jgi:hypothetical protein